MAHNIHRDAEGDDAMWCVGNREAAWHRLGQRTPDAQTWQQAQKLAKLDWEVEKVQLYGPKDVNRTIDALGRFDDNARQVESWGVFRKTDSQFLGAVGKAYNPIQNSEIFSFVDTLLEAENGAHYESAGALGNGERIWCMALIPHEVRIAGTDDRSRVYLLFVSSHDGSVATRGKLSLVRVVCMNTFNAALSSSGASFVVRHTKEAQNKLAEARKLMQGAAMDVKALEQKFNVLANRKMQRSTIVTILDRLFPSPEEKGSQASKTRHERIVTEVLKEYESNDLNVIPEVRGTAWNMLNAITAWTDHARPAYAGRYGTVEATRAHNAIFGTGESFKEQALETILEVTADAPLRASRSAYVEGGVGVAEPEVILDMSVVDSIVDKTLTLDDPR